MSTTRKYSLYLMMCITIVYLFISLSCINMLFRQGSESNKNSASVTDLNVCNEINLLIKDELINLAKEIHEAKKHVRGTKTSSALFRAERGIKEILIKIKVDFEKETSRTLRNSQNVCPEIYKGSKFGYYFFDTGFVVDNCTYTKPLDQLITIVLLYDKQQTFNINNLYQAIRKYNKQIRIIFGHSISAESKRPKQRKYINMKVVDFHSEEFQGRAWNKMIANVNTPYTLIARDVMWFNHDARLDRLIRQIERLNVTSAAGAYRHINGHWMTGCQQRVFRNFTLVYKAGYDESIEECLFCDHIDGPFVSTTNKLKAVKFNENINKMGLFEELFYRLSDTEHVVCPDAMFYTNRTERSYEASDWKSFQSQWKVYKIRFSGKEIMLPTPSYGCYGKGNSLSPWCQKENADVLYAAMKTCVDKNIICELDSGSVMGAVKFHSILPWERDADMVFRTEDLLILQNAKSNWTNMGYKLNFKDTRKCCYGNTTKKMGGYFGLLSKHWRLEMFGRPTLTSEPRFIDNMTATQCSVQGHWMRSPRNPGLYARNRYGRELYQHAQHWSDTHLKTSWMPYKPNRFLPCSNPGGHNCLDRYNSDGSLQFSDPLP